MYKNLNDNEILYMIKENNDNDYRLIFNKYESLIYKIIHKYKFIAKKYGIEKDDLYQICCMSLIKAIELYDDKYDNLFYTYLYRLMENSIINELKSNCSFKKLTLSMACSYDKIVPNTNLSYLEIIPDKKNLFKSFSNEEEIIRFKNTLSFDLSCLFELKMNGYKNSEITILLSKIPSEISYGLSIIKKRFLSIYVYSMEDI